MNGTLRPLGIFSIVMITVTSVDSLRNLPGTALFGSAMIFFFTIAGLCFLLPSGLVASELSSGWPKTGGIYIWIKEAFGPRWGFLAIWCQWLENVIWYPTILSFIAGALAFIISPDLAGSQYYLMSVIITVFWGLTFLNMAGITLSAKFSEWCGVLGLILPMTFILILALCWVWGGQPIQVHFSIHDVFPRWNDPELLVSLTAIVLSFCGMEIATVHAQDVKNPERTYPIALVISVIFIFLTMLLGALSIAIVVPAQKLSLVSGIVQAFHEYLSAYHLSWMVPLIAVSIIFGALAAVSNWVIAPNRGLLVAIRDLKIAPFFQYENKRGAPARLLLLQSILVTCLSLTYLVMPSVNSSYWVLTAMTAQVYMIMYILMFAAVVKLRYSQKNTSRPFKIPGGLPVVWLVAIVGISASVLTILIGFFPPKALVTGGLFHYEVVLITGLIVTTCLPLFLVIFRKLLQKLL